MRPAVARLAIALTLATAIAPVAARAECDVQRLLVLSAYPGEIYHLLDASDTEPVSVDGHRMFVGTLAGEDVVLALTGIGKTNARATTEAALDNFCISAVVFSGVAGGKTNIGDVAVPKDWVDDEGGSFTADASMLAVAESIADSVDLTRAVPAGDAICAGIDPDLIEMVTLPHEPDVIVGGEGKTADSFGGRAFPCIPGGGDVFGCDPCTSPSPADHAGSFVERALPFLDPAFFFGYFSSPPPAATTYDAEDMETAAVARAAQGRAPFIAFRGVSDGNGDQLMLPGFPFQFFFYRQVAANNAAAVTLAFLAAL